MSDTESSARSSDDSDEEIDEEETEEEEEEEDDDDEEEEDVDEEDSEEAGEEVEEEEDEEDKEGVTDDETDENDQSDEDGDQDTDENEEENESVSDVDSDIDERKIGGPAANIKIKERKEKTRIETQPVGDKLVIKKSPGLQQNSDSSDDTNSGNSNSENQENEVKVKDQATKIDSKKENKREAQPVESVKKKSTELQQNSDLGDDSSSDKNSDRGKQESERKEKGLLARIETRESGKESKTKPKHVEDESEKEESQELKQRSDANDGFKRNSKSDDQVSDGKVKDPAAKIENKESKQETKIEAQPVESVRKDLSQKIDLAEDSKGNDNSKSDKQKLGGKMKELAVNMQNKENEKEIKINAQHFEDKLVRSESPELQQESYLAKNFKRSNNSKIDEQESDGKVKDPAAKSEFKEIKKETKIKVQPVEDKSVRKELAAFGQKNHSADKYKSDEQVVEVKVPAADSETKESNKETKIYTQPVESESVGKSSEQANKALPTEKKDTKKEDFRQTTEVPREYGLNKRVQVDRYDVMSTRRVGTQTGLKHHSVGTFTSGLIKKVNMQTYTSGLISTSDHSTNTIQKRGNNKKTQTEDQYVLESHLTVKYNDSSEKTTTDDEDTTKESGENETSVQLNRSKRKIPLLKLSYSPNLTESTENRPPPSDSLSKKGTQSKDIKSNQKHKKTPPLESSGVYSNKEHGKKTRKEKENIRRRGVRRRQFFIYSKRHPSGEYIPKPSKNKISLFRPTSAGPVYKRESINLMHRPEDSIPTPSQNRISLRPNSAGPVHKRQCKHPEGTPLSAAQYRMLYHHRWPDIPF